MGNSNTINLYTITSDISGDQSVNITFSNLDSSNKTYTFNSATKSVGLTSNLDYLNYKVTDSKNEEIASGTIKPGSYSLDVDKNGNANLNSITSSNNSSWWNWIIGIAIILFVLWLLYKYMKK